MKGYLQQNTDTTTLRVSSLVPKTHFHLKGLKNFDEAFTSGRRHYRHSCRWTNSHLMLSATARLSEAVPKLR